MAGEPVVDEDAGLERADQVVQRVAVPLLGRALPAAVEPDEVDRPVVGEQLAHLGEQELEVACPPRVARARRHAEGVGTVGVGEGGVVGVVPVGQREVEADAQAAGARRRDAVTHAGPTGVGVAESRLYDQEGPIGRSLQALLIGRRGG